MSALDRHFSAFVSYCQQDTSSPGQGWAEWVQNHLQSYKTPDELVGQTSIYGDPVPASMPHIFRDKGQLPGTGDLDAMLKEALSRSRILIVLCTPAAARSSWVDDEVRHFKQLGHARRIIAVVLQGRPHAGADSSSECYPPSLAYELNEDGTPDRLRLAHPVFIDLRPEDAPCGATTSDAYAEVLRKLGKHRDEYIKIAAKAYSDRLENARIMLLSGALGLYTPELTQREVLRQIEERKQREIENAEKLALARERTRGAIMLSVVFGLLLICASLATIFAIKSEKRAIEAERVALESERKLKVFAIKTSESNTWKQDITADTKEPILRELIEYYRSSKSADSVDLAWLQGNLVSLGELLFGNIEVTDDQILDKKQIERRKEANKLWLEALAVNRRAVQLYPNEVGANMNLAAALYRLGHVDRVAAPSFTDAQKIEKLQASLKSYEESSRVFDRGLAIVKTQGITSEELAKWTVYNWMADAYQGQIHEKLAAAYKAEPSRQKLELQNAIECRSRAIEALETAISLLPPTSSFEELKRDWNLYKNGQLEFLNADASQLSTIK